MIELTEEHKIKLVEIDKFSTMARFNSIEKAIVIERMISNILVNYLGNEQSKRSLEKYLFYDTLTFDQKINLFNSLNKAKVFNATKNNELLNSDLVKLKTIRNYMAHSMVYNDIDFLNKYDGKEIKFKSYTSKNMVSDITFRIYDKEDNVEKLIFSYNAHVARIQRIVDSLDDILRIQIVASKVKSDTI